MTKLRSIAAGSERRSSGVVVSYNSLTAWSRPGFSPTRIVPFTTAAGLLTALNAMAAGDLIVYTGTGVLTISTTTSGYNNFSNKNPSGIVVIDLGVMGSGANVKFQYTGTANFPAIWLHDSSNLHIFGGEMSTPNGGGTGILWQGACNGIYWWDYVIHDTGGGGMGMFPIKTDGSDSTIIQNCWTRGEIYNWGQNLAWDPHQEPGTGMHAVNTADSKVTNPSAPGYGNVGNFWDNTIAVYVHHGPGAAIEFGEAAPNAGKTGSIHGNTFYCKAVDLYFVATLQVAGNVFQIWGNLDLTSTVIGWAEGNNIQGRVVDGQGLSSASRVNGGKVTVNHGRHVNTNQNPNLGSTESGVSSSEPYDSRWGITYNDCT